MAQQRSFDNLTIEELIALADKERTVDTSDKMSAIERFIFDTQITVVDKMPRTESPNVYWAYCKWCKANDRVPATRKLFFREFKTKYEMCNSTKGVKTFWIDPTPFEISKDEWWEMRRVLRREPKKRSKATKKQG